MLEASQLAFAAEEVLPRRLDAPLGNAANDEPLLARIGALEREKRELEILIARLESSVKQLTHLVYADALTGLSNRRHFDSELHAAVHRAALSSQPLALLMCDIDLFKHCNDTYGHGAGDAVLTEIANLLRAFRRSEHDCAARHGGDEFALLLPATGAKDALLLAERIRNRVAGLTIDFKSDAATVCGSARVTISVGVTTVHGPATVHGRPIVDAADTALYRAKRAGGNRTKYQHVLPPQRRST